MTTRNITIHSLFDRWRYTLSTFCRGFRVAFPAVAMILLLIVSIACRRTTGGKVLSEVAVPDSVVYQANQPDGLPARVYTAINESSDGFIDSTGMVINVTRPFEGNVSGLYRGVFVMGRPGNMNVYSVLNLSQPLNAEPFSSLTDFRMGVAYGTRPGRPLMVVNTSGLVVRILPDFIRTVTLPAAGGRQVAVTTSDVPMSARLTESGEEFFRFDDSFRRDSTFFWPSIELISKGDGTFRMFSWADGRALGLNTVKPFDTGRFATVATDFIHPDEALDFVDGISSAGWEIDSSFYSASTPGQIVSAKAGFTPETSLYYHDRQRDPVFALSQQGGQPVYMTLTEPPYKNAFENTGFGSFFSLFARPEENLRSRLRTITLPVITPPALGRQFMKAAEKLVLQRGFIGFADKSHAFKGAGNTYLYFVPSNRGFFIVMAFGELDYDRLMSAANHSTD